MKSKHIVFFLCLSIVILSSCRELTISTVVNKDGSFTRVVTITGDSSEVLKPDLPYPVDETWTRVFRKDTTAEKSYLLTFTKTFKNSNLLDMEINQDTSWRKRLNRKINVEKNFGFFYSYIVYDETIEAVNMFDTHDYKDFLNAEDMLWLTGKKLALNSSDSTQVKVSEDKASTFFQEVITEEIIKSLKSGLAQLNDPSIFPEQVEKYRDSIASRVDQWDFSSSLEFVDNYAVWTKNNEVLKIKKLSLPLFEKLDIDLKFIENVFEMESYAVSVEMPGIITETNSLSTSGNLVDWKVNPNAILFEDLNMHVESRLINKWMFVLSGLILLSFIGLIIFKSRK